MDTAKNLAIFGGSVLAVLLVAPVVMALVDRLTGGAWGRAYDSTIGAATGYIAGVTPTSISKDVGLAVENVRA
jgi:hypothetical protein